MTKECECGIWVKENININDFMIHKNCNWFKSIKNDGDYIVVYKIPNSNYSCAYQKYHVRTMMNGRIASEYIFKIRNDLYTCNTNFFKLEKIPSNIEEAFAIVKSLANNIDFM